MSDNTEVLAGYTKELLGSCDTCDLHLFVKPDVDLDSRFKAYDADNCEWIAVNGWLWTFVTVEG